MLFFRIREFCLSNMPIIMFDKNEDYVVLTVDEACLRLVSYIILYMLTVR